MWKQRIDIKLKKNETHFTKIGFNASETPEKKF